MNTETLGPELNRDLRTKDKCIAVLGSHTDAEAAIRELGHADFEMKALSIIGMDFHTEENVVGFYNAGDRVKHWGKRGAFWGGLFGLLLSPAFFWIPGIGPVLTGGIVGSALMGMIEGGVVGAVIVGGMSALGGALFSIGIPKDSVLGYERDLRAGKYLVMVHGTQADAYRARDILQGYADQVATYAPEPLLPVQQDAERDHAPAH